MTIELTGTTAIVTGATGGMGRAITARLAAAGADVIATDLSDAGADALLAAAPGSVHFVAADVSAADDVAGVIAS
jgi:NAD(P)-dependent dehydrogenase (short-subunit alcohol dehydrogenase family)